MRQGNRQRVIAGAVLGALPLLLSTGCSFNFSVGGPGAVDAEQVAEQSSQRLAEQIGQTPDDFTCSEDLPAEVGAEIRCELTHGGESLGVTVTTTSVDGDNIQWDIKVDEAPADGTAADEGTAAEQDTANDGSTGSTGMASDGRVPVEEVTEKSTAALRAQGRSPQELTCSSAYLRAEVGAEARCNFFENSVLHQVTVTVTSVEGDTVTWDVQVDE